jgi:hypothetical protein
MKDQTQEPTISVLVEIPERLHQAVQTYLRSMEGIEDDQDSVFVEALSLYMLGKGVLGMTPNPFSDDKYNLFGRFHREGK